MKISPTTRLGVACLGITHPHTSGRVKALNKMENVEVTCAVDDSHLTPVFADAFGLEVRTKQQVMEDPNTQVVIIHSKSDKMADLAIEALEAGKAVLVEKPAGRNSDDARRIRDAAERTGGLLQVGYCWRHAPSVAAMHEALKSGRLGKVMQVRAHGGTSHDEAATSHLNQPEDMGGAMFVIGCHLIDQIIHHFGMPLSVNARVSKFPGQMDENFREDAAGAVLSYRDKMVVVDFFSWDPLPWLESWNITAYGTDGVMHANPLPASYKIYDTGRQGHNRGWSAWQDTTFPLQWASKKTEYSPELAEIGNPFFFEREAEAFVNSIRTGTPSQVPAQQALNVNLLIEALFASSQQSGAEVIPGT